MSRYAQRGDGDSVVYLERRREDSQVSEDVPPNRVDGGSQNEDPDDLIEETSDHSENDDPINLLTSDEEDLESDADESEAQIMMEDEFEEYDDDSEEDLIGIEDDDDDEKGLTPDRIKRFSTFNADQKSVLMVLKYTS